VTIRVLLICHGSTAATRRSAFPLDEPLDASAVTDAVALRERLAADRSWGRRAATGAVADGGAALRCRQTAEALGLTLKPVAELDDWNLGRWAGLTLDDVVEAEPDAVHGWLADPDAAPHDGESLTALLTRAGTWLDGIGTPGTGTTAAATGLEGLDGLEPGAAEGTTRVVVVTHAAVIRAILVHALKAPPATFWRIDVPPLSTAELSGILGRWSLRL
jgi:broad specificity phosphatase PhoE